MLARLRSRVRHKAALWFFRQQRHHCAYMLRASSARVRSASTGRNWRAGTCATPGRRAEPPSNARRTSPSKANTTGTPRRPCPGRCRPLASIPPSGSTSAESRHRRRRARAWLSGRNRLLAGATASAMILASSPVAMAEDKRQRRFMVQVGTPGEMLLGEAGVTPCHVESPPCAASPVRAGQPSVSEPGPSPLQVKRENRVQRQAKPVCEEPGLGWTMSISGRALSLARPARARSGRDREGSHAGRADARAFMPT